MVRGALRTHPGVPFYLLGCLVVALSTLHALLHLHELELAFGGFALTMLLASTLYYAGYRLERMGISGETAMRVFGVTIGIGLLGLALGGAVILVVRLGGHQVPEVHSLLLMAATAGFAAGAPLGFYYYQFRAHNHELSERYAENRKLNERLSVTQRVLRHNLRNELSVTIGMTEQLLRTADEREAILVRKLHSHQQRLVALAATANDIRRTWEHDEVIRQDLVSVVNEVVRNVRASSPTARITADLPCRAAVRAHPMIGQAISEVLDNAVEHGGGDVEVTCRPTEVDGGSTRLRVADHGAGIPEEEVAALDNPRETSLEHGMGLGLRLVQAVVEQSDGTLSIGSNVPHGTVVVIDLPVAE